MIENSYPAAYSASNNDAMSLRLINHLEAHLGPLICGWFTDPDGAPVPFSVLKFGGGSIADVFTYVTVGLSAVELRSKNTEKIIHQELLLMCRESFGTRNIPGLLQQVGLSVLADKTAILRGEVLGPKGPIFTECDLTAFYATNPVYFPDSFLVDDLAVLVWLVPITSPEAKFVQNNGWISFEDCLVSKDPDLLDFSRPSIV